MSADQHTALIARFYEAFARRDAAGMTACYHADIHFTDEVFPDLRGAKAGAMWTMLCARGADLRVESSRIKADDARGDAHWDAYYTFSATGRKVHNSIDATFKFQDGLIVRHVDRFEFWRWSRQALGVPGLLLGWSPFLRSKVRAQAATALERFISGAKST